MQTSASAAGCAWVCCCLCLIAASVDAAASTGGCKDKTSWCKYSVQCINDSRTVNQWTAASEHSCLLSLINLMDPKRNSTADDLVVQWNKQTGVCSLFRYQHVCRIMQTSGVLLTGSEDKTLMSSACSVYRAAALVSCTASLNAHLLGVWLAGGSNRFSNLVCQSEPNNYRLISVNLQWTEEGAKFDGVSSYALLNDSRFMPGAANSSFTWLMRLKRQPRGQPLIEATSCSNSTLFGPHFWEYDKETQLYYDSGGRTPPFDIGFRSPVGSLPNSSLTWIDIGITFSGASLNASLYYNGSIIPALTTLIIKQDPQLFCYILWIGRRYGDPSTSAGFLSGVVSAVAAANDSMTLQEIRSFFSLLP